MPKNTRGLGAASRAASVGQLVLVPLKPKMPTGAKRALHFNNASTATTLNAQLIASLMAGHRLAVARRLAAVVPRRVREMFPFKQLTVAKPARRK